MSAPTGRLYQLLPAIYRIRDQEAGGPLEALLRVMDEQVAVVESDISTLYENWFVETCEDWVAPYLGDLIGYRPVHEAGDPSDLPAARARALTKILVPRREVAHTIRNRRRKGVLSLLEQIASDVAGWPARAVEFGALVAVTHAVDRPTPAGRTIAVSDLAALDGLGGPFDTAVHTASVGGGDPSAAPRYGPNSVGLFVWRLRAYGVHRTPACRVEGYGDHCFTFSALGNDAPLFSRAPDAESAADESRPPGPISRAALRASTAAFYGDTKSLAVWLAKPSAGESARPEMLVPIDDIVSADLSTWDHDVGPGKIAVDPVRGRFAFAPGKEPQGDVWVSYWSGFSAEIGGGEYDRVLRPAILRPASGPVPPRTPDAETIVEGGAPALPLLYRVSRRAGRAKGSQKSASIVFDSLDAALEQWNTDAVDDAVIELVDSDVYGLEEKKISLGSRRLEIRAANRTRPIVRLVDKHVARSDSLLVRLGAGGAFELDGLLVAGRGVEFRRTRGDGAHDGAARQSGENPYGSGEQPDQGGLSPDACPAVRIRHSTLVPGWLLDSDCEPHQPDEPSLEFVETPIRVVVERSIIGSIHVTQDAAASEPLSISLSDSVLDATRHDLPAVRGSDLRAAHAVMTIARCTVFGRTVTHAIDLAENSIFMGDVEVARQQRGCMRFCYVPTGSKTPGRYRCQPDVAVAGLDEDARALAELQVRPRFNSVRYGTPTYAQLARDCPDEIRRGADDRSEMGVFHDLFQPQRRANLTARLEEYVPVGVDVEVIEVT